MSFDPTLIAQARTEIHTAGFGMKTDTAKKWAALLNITPQTLYHIINNGNGKRERRGNPLKPEYQEWAKIIWQVKNRPPKDAGVLSTIDAIASALKQKLIPEDAGKVSVGTYNRIARTNGWQKREKRRNQIQAESPNDCHHFDGASSKFFYIAHKNSDGDYILKIHRPGAGGYKNKPIPEERLRPYYYSLVDDYSGRLMSECYPLKGESAGSSVEFLLKGWKEFGLCKELSVDRGMLQRCLATHKWIRAVGVELSAGRPYEKESHGKVENPWKNIWLKFELTFFAEVLEYEKFGITLTEFNRQYQNFIEQTYNQLPHRFEKNITKMQAWKKVNLKGGIIRLPDDALSICASLKKRRIDIFGKLHYPGGPYEVIGLHNAWVWVYEALFSADGMRLSESDPRRIVVQEIETGKKFEVKKFKPLTRGQFRSHSETPYEKIVKESAGLQLQGTGLYADKKPENEKIISMPIRTKEQREIEDPFNVDTYPSIREAMDYFMSYLPGVFLNPIDREVIEKEIEANGLSKKFVENFALEVRAQLLKRAVG